MKVLVIGSGAREHAIVWKLRQSKDVSEVFCSPGNGGLETLAKLVPAPKEEGWDFYVRFARERQIDLTVVGPENPLAGGIVDAFRAQGLRIFGPDAKAARLEASKIFAKEFMRQYGMPTARCEVFDDAKRALHYAGNAAYPLVVKADGLAAGKGVSVCASLSEARAAIEDMLVKKVFGPAGARILIEECLTGKELSLMAFCDGKTIRALPTARDYKRVHDDNQGPNTGGMGAISPCPVSAETLKRIEDEVVRPFLKGIQSERLDYRGLIYFGLMLTDKGPSVLEFNVRFGDPETQVVLPLLESDLAGLFNAVVDRNLGKVSFKVSSDACLGVVCASGGYPGAFESRKEISGLEAAPAGGSLVFHAGTVREGDKFYTSGGRVLTVVSRGPSLEKAREKSYQAAAGIRFDKMHYRKDIGAS